MNIRIWLLPVFLVSFFVLASNAQSQNASIEFRDLKNRSKKDISDSEFKSVNFTILGLNSEEKRSEIHTILLNNENIKECNLALSGKCWAFIKKDYSAVEMRSLLLSADTDFDFGTIIINDRSLTCTKKRVNSEIPDDFPSYIDTGNPKIDLKNYHEAKQLWIASNPERFEKIKHLNLDK